jgi:hypothetical protein
MGLFIVGIIFILFIILILIVVFIITNNTKYFIKKGGNNNILNNDIMYYSICNHDYGLKYEKLESILQKHNFIMVSADKPTHVSFGSSEKITIHNEKKSYHDPLFITQNAAIKNTLGGQKQIIDKVMLFKTIKQLIPSGIKYLPKTYTIFVQFKKTLAMSITFIFMRFPMYFLTILTTIICKTAFSTF